MNLFRNKQFQKVLAEIGVAAGIGLLIVSILSYLSIPVWFLTHHYNHTHFTWYVIWLSYGTVALCIGLTLGSILD